MSFKFSSSSWVGLPCTIGGRKLPGQSTAASPKSPHLHPIGERPQYPPVARKRDRREDGERQLQAHHRVQDVVQVRHVVNRAVERRQERGHHRDAPREQHPLPPRPAQVQEALHGELARVRSGHRGALSRRQDTYRPDVGRCYPE